MAEIIIAISIWCGAATSSTEVKECRKTILKCVRQKVTCSDCWSWNVPASLYDFALGICIEESL